MNMEKGNELDDEFIKKLKSVAGLNAGEIQKFIEQGANVNYRQPATGLTPLIAASIGFRGHATVKALLDNYSPEINAKDTKGETAFSRAISNSNWLSALYLLENGADIEMRGSESKVPKIASSTVYILAGAKQGDIEYLQKGIAMGGDINAKAGDTAMLLAIQVSGATRYNTIQYCLEHNASIEHLTQSKIDNHMDSIELKKIKQLLARYGVPE
jgi:ankyrin repeat protein